MTALSDLTTLRVGGPARELVEAVDEQEVLGRVRAADTAGDPLLVLGGGSNLVVSDAGFPGTVLHLRTRGVTRVDEPDHTLLTAAAGEPWDEFVSRCVDDGLAGAECLSGIPGYVGATPIQNVGAYGQDVSQTITSVRVYDRRRGEVRELAAAECGFSYRSSEFKRHPGRFVVLAVTFALVRRPTALPIRYAELTRELGGEPTLRDVRDSVLRVRARKGMVLDAADPDSASAGSFFTNPILAAARFDELARRADGLPRFPEPDGRVKTSAAWLVEHAGFGRGYGLPGPAAVSSKHTLALTNRGGATAAEIVALAGEIAAGVRERFGVELVPEPVFVGIGWPP